MVRDHPAEAAFSVDAKSRRGHRSLPALDEDLPDADSARPPPEPTPFAKPIPQPRTPDPLQLPEFKRHSAPMNPIVFRPMIPGTIDPILALRGRQRSGAQPVPESESPGNDTGPDDFDSDGFIRPVDIFMNHVGPNPTALWLHSRFTILLAILAIGALLGGAGWLLLSALKSSGL